MNKTKKLKISNPQSGFTIVELMIAMSVLSVLLVLATLTLINLGRTYTKGNNQALVQNTARNTVDEIASQLKLSGAEPDLTQFSSGVFCIGSTRYAFLIGRQVSSDPGSNPNSPNQTRHALWRDSGGAGCPALSATDLSNNATPPGGSGGTELIPEHMRLTRFNISSVSGRSGYYNIELGVAYGDNDLLCDSAQPSHCDATWIANNEANHANNLQNPTGKIVCVGDIGQEYCAVSYLDVVVGRRL